MSEDLRLEITSPTHFDRSQLALRVLLAVVLGGFGIIAHSPRWTFDTHDHVASAA